jgi:hypothetical protein
LAISLWVNDLATAYEGNIAGQRVQSSLPFAFMERGKTINEPVVAMAASAGETQSEVAAELEGRRVRLLARHTAQHSEFIEHADGVQLRVCRFGNWVHLNQQPTSASLASWLLGPGLLLALARHEVLALHASALALPGDDRAVLFLGRSGASKSSIARAALTIGGRRYTDDISPIAVEHGQLKLLPVFPQLKLDHVDPRLPQQVAVRAIVALDAFAPTLQITQILEPMSLTKRLLAHTVATRLFNAQDHAVALSSLAAIGSALANRFYLVQPQFAPDHPADAAEELLARLVATLELNSDCH